MKSSVSKETVELCWAKKKNKKFGIKQLVKSLKWQLDPHNNYSIITIAVLADFIHQIFVLQLTKTVSDCGWSLIEKNKQSGELLEPKH